MKSVNRVTLLGRAGKDPEIKATSGGTTIANLSLATEERYKDSTGNWQSRTEWHSLVAFKRTAEIFQQYVRKGSQLYVEGKIQTRSWEKDGQKHYRTEILVNELVLLDGGKEKSTVPDYSPFKETEPVVDDPDCPF